MLPSTRRDLDEMTLPGSIPDARKIERTCEVNQLCQERPMSGEWLTGDLCASTALKLATYCDDVLTVKMNLDGSRETPRVRGRGCATERY